MFSRSKYQNRVEGEALKILRYQTHKSDIWFGLQVGRKDNFMAYPPTVSLKLLSRSCIFKVKIRLTFRALQDEKNYVSHIKIGDTLKFENLKI
jgi:hypothetical protein